MKNRLSPTNRRIFLRGALAFTGLIFIPKFARGATSNIKRAFGTPTSVTCTLASLLTSNARESNAINNSSDLFIDAMLELRIKLQAGTPGSDQAIFIYFAASEDGTNYTDPATGSDAAI